MNFSRIGPHWLCGAAVISVGCIVTGCVTSRSPSARARANPQTHQSPAGMPAPIMTTPARVTIVNQPHAFVVIDFSARLVPPVGSRVDVYRGATRVGAVHITELIKGRFAAADVIEGELKSGDEVR